MKRIICLITTLCIVLGSFSFCFAVSVDWDSSDHTHLTEIRNTFMSGGGMYNLVNAINSNLTTIDSHLYQIYQAINPSASGSTANILNNILNMLSYTDAGGALKSFISDMDFTLDGIYLKSQDIDSRFLLGSYPTYLRNHPNTQVTWGIYNNGSYSTDYFTPDNTPFFASLFYFEQELTQNTAHGFTDLLNGFNSSQSFTKWDDLTSSSFTPSSTTNGIYTWLSKIQNPVARLSYVLASDERIEAQEAAAANEEAVVDNFIDSSGAGSASPSDIGSISDLSSGYQNNFGSDASVSGIFNIFNSNNMGWFSQETANQLDTTAPIRRGSSFDTPLLDQQINDIYDQIGVKHD